MDGDTIAREAAAVTIDWTEAGSFELCLEADNVCHLAEPDCKIITVSAPSVSRETSFLCDDDCYILPDATEVCAAGTYNIMLLDQLGCDSLVAVELLAASSDTTTLAATLCTNDSLFLSGDTLISPGNYLFRFNNAKGCDSIVMISLTWATGCSYAAFLESESVTCNGRSDGAISLSFGPAADYPVTYVIESLEGELIMSGSIMTEDQRQTIEGLASTTYLLSAVDRSANRTFGNVFIETPVRLTTSFKTSFYEGYGVSCPEVEDGYIELSAHGGTPPYTASWDDGTTGFLVRNLGPGERSARVTDGNGCEASVTVSLLAPPPLAVEVITRETDCTTPNTWGLEALRIAGGVAPYDTVLATDTGDEIFASEYGLLETGNYTIYIEDLNGCRFDSQLVIEPTLLPTLSLGVSSGVVETGDLVEVVVEGSNLDSILWPEGVVQNCFLCTVASFSALRTRVVAVSGISQDGCMVSDSVRLIVIQRERVYVPNVFSPNGDGVNDRFGPLVGSDVARIENFEVYDRWGGQVYTTVDRGNGTDALPEWEGKNKDGTNSPSGVYLYRFTAKFTNGSERQYQGALTLLR